MPKPRIYSDSPKLDSVLLHECIKDVQSLTFARGTPRTATNAANISHTKQVPVVLSDGVTYYISLDTQPR